MGAPATAPPRLRLLRKGHVGAIAPVNPIKLSIDERDTWHDLDEREEPLGEGMARVGELTLRPFWDPADRHQGLHHVAAGGLGRAAPDAEQIVEEQRVRNPRLLVPKAAAHVVGQQPAPHPKVAREEHG